jgi:hypothetical protein
MKVIPVNYTIRAGLARTLSGVKEGLVEDGRYELFEFAIHFQGNFRFRKNLHLQNYFAHKDPNKSVEGVYTTL